MKMQGHIKPTAETADLWRQLRDAKAQGNRQMVGRMSDEIRKAHRYGHQSVDGGIKV